MSKHRAKYKLLGVKKIDDNTDSAECLFETHDPNRITAQIPIIYKENPEITEIHLEEILTRRLAVYNREGSKIMAKKA